MATFNAVSSLLPVLLFSAALLLSSAPTLEAQLSAPVLDGDGDPVRIGSLYQISRGDFGFVGGLTTLPSAIKTACAKPIGPGMETDPGLPVTFKPGRPQAGEGGILRVNVRSTFTFQLSSPTPCADPGVWTGSQTNSSDAKPLTVIVAGREQGSSPSRAWFEVRETDKKRVYTLAYCSCLLCRNICPGLGIQAVGEEGVLGIGLREGQRAYHVRFEKYHQSPI